MPPIPPSGSDLPADAAFGAPPPTPRPAGYRLLRRGEWRLLWLVAALFLLHGLPWRLEEDGQARQAFASLEMVQAGHWAVQHLPGRPETAAAPPLAAWVSAGLYYLAGGHWEIAWRLPSLLAALALLALLWAGGEKIWPGWGGTLAAAAFALNPLTLTFATHVGADLPLTLWLTLIGLIVWRHAGGGGSSAAVPPVGNGGGSGGVTGAGGPGGMGTGDDDAAPLRPWAAGGRHTLPFLDPARHPWMQTFSLDRWAVFLLLSAALLTTGPAAYAFLLPGMIAHGLISRHRAKKAGAADAAGNVAAAAGVFRADLWGGWWHWTLPLLPFLFWLERGIVTTPGFAQQAMSGVFPGGFSSAAEAARLGGQPFYFYFAELLWRWAPWSVLLLAVRLRGPSVWWSLWRDPRNLWLVCWAASGLVVLTLLPDRRTERIFPVLPPLCLLLAAALRRAEEAGGFRRDEAAEGMLPRIAANAPSAVGLAARVSAAWPRAWSHFTLRVGILAALAGTFYAAGLAFWQRGHSVSRFAEQARAATAGRRVELVAPDPGAADEALLVGLRRLEFVTPVQALQLWTTGRVDALAFSRAALEKSRAFLEPALPLAQPALSLPGPDNQPAYILVTRGAETPPLTIPPRAPAPDETPPARRRAARKKKPL